jgi:AcrR family transcriptional regulator
VDEVAAALSPRALQIATVSRELLESGGPAALSMRNVAARLGLQAASLYEHLPNKAALEDVLIAVGLYEQGDAMLEAADGAGDPLVAIAAAYRAYAVAHPHLYRLVASRPLEAADIVAPAEEHMGRALRRLSGGDAESELAIVAFARGMIDLELSGRIPPAASVDELWRRGLDALRALLPAPPAG